MLNLNEYAHSINGVDGRMLPRHIRDASLGTWSAQVWKASRQRDGQRLTVTLRFDDECGNGHNSFSIVADHDVFERGKWRDFAGGCLHDEIREWFPELAPLIPWHLTSTDGPMHYVANTLYWLGYSGWCDGERNSPPNLDHARSTAVWPDMPADYICPAELRTPIVGTDIKQRRDELAASIRTILDMRLRSTMVEFADAMRAAGLAWEPTDGEVAA